jgi:hypothetical protein
MTPNDSIKAAVERGAVLLKQLPLPVREELRELSVLERRIARVRRIKRHIAAYPGKSYCYPEEAR